MMHGGERAGIELDGVVKRFAANRQVVTAVDRLSLSAVDELLVLLGPSGSGKTTTLRLIAGLEKPTQGRIRLAGEDVARWPPWRRNVAMVFQTSALYPHRSVRQNLAAGAPRQGGAWPWSVRARAWRQEVAARVADVAQLLDLQELLDRRPEDLSGGERQRVALGRAVIRQPAVFLLDEPLAHLDERLRAAARRELRELRQRLRATMVYVTHDHAEALALGDRIAVIEQGVLRQLGTPRQVYDEPADRFVAGFVGSLPMNLVDGRWRASSEFERAAVKGEATSAGRSGPRSEPSAGTRMFCGGGWRLRYLPGSESAADFGERATALLQVGEQAFTLGIRPEDVQLGPGDDRRRRGPGLVGWARVRSVDWTGDAVTAQLSPAEAPAGLVAEVEREEVIPLAARWPLGLGVAEDFGTDGCGNSRLRVAVGDRIQVQLPAAGWHGFDAASGRRLTAGEMQSRGGAKTSRDNDTIEPGNTE